MDILVPATDDADTLVELWLDLADGQRSYGSRLLTHENSERIRKSILYHIVNETLLVAVDDSIQGFVMFSTEDGGYAQDRNRGVIENLYVRPQYRNDGVGSELLAAAEARLTDRGVDTISLEVLATNDRGREFYARHGYEPHRLELEKSVDDSSVE